jgi:hypothetical protein
MLRKYNSTFRKRLLTKLEAIKKKENIIDIYKLIEDNTKDDMLSENLNGIFVDINKLSDSCIESIDNYIKFIDENKKENTDDYSKSFINKFDTIDMLTEIGHKLSSHEKCIIKKLHKD